MFFTSTAAKAGAIQEAAKIAPPAAVGISGAMGSIDWEPWVLFATLIYTLLLGSHKAWTFYRDVRDDKRKD